MAQRLFTDAELEAMGTETVDLVVEAIRAGRLEEAEALARRMREEFMIIHEAFRDNICYLLSFIGERYGDAELDEAFRFAYTNPINEHVKNSRFAELDLRGHIEGMAKSLRSHLVPLQVDEDDEKVTLMMKPCGSGGRAILNGSYDPPKNSFLRVKTSQLMTFGNPNFPVYCCHCQYQNIVMTEATGIPAWLTLVPSDPGREPCRFVIYKDPDKIPAEIYEMFGKQKPESPKTNAS